MTSIRKFAYAALLAAAALNLAPSLASAQEPARGKFTLTHDVRWGTARVPAGEYAFSFNTEGFSPVLMLSKINGAPAGYMVLVSMTEEIKTSSINELELETNSDGSYVSAMQLPEFGMTLHFNTPHTEKAVAKTTLASAVSGQ